MQGSSARNGRKSLLLAAPAALVVLLSVCPGYAFEGRSGNKVIVGPSEVVDNDLYAGADTITVDGTVRGDLVAAGRIITVNGTVEGDLIAAGQVITINGRVGDDARIAGQILLLGDHGQVGDDVVGAAYSLETRSGSSIGGDLQYFGYQALVGGNVGGGLHGSMGALDLRGAIDGEVEVSTGSAEEGFRIPRFMPSTPVPVPIVQPGLTVSNSARIGEKLTYRSSSEGYIDPAAQLKGGVKWERRAEKEVTRPKSATDMVLEQVRRFVALLLVGLLLMWWRPTWTGSLSDTIQARPLPCLGWGIVALVAFLIAAVAVIVVTILLMAIFGLLTMGPLVLLVLGLGFLAEAILVIGYLVFTGFAANIAVGYLGGRWAWGKMHPSETPGRVPPLLIGIALLVILTAVPFLGGLISLVVFFLGLGALWIWGRGALARPKPAPSQGAA